MKITLKAPNGKRQVVRGHHLERALRMQGWTDADTAPQTCFHHPRLMAYPSAVAFFSIPPNGQALPKAAHLAAFGNAVLAAVLFQPFVRH